MNRHTKNKKCFGWGRARDGALMSLIALGTPKSRLQDMQKQTRQENMAQQKRMKY